jgi:hypothetical protein
MSNSFITQPLWLDTGTSTGANTNWRGTSGCTLAGIGSHGIKPTRILVLPAASGTAIAAGTITISDPQSFTTLLTIPIVLPSASELSRFCRFCSTRRQRCGGFRSHWAIEFHEGRTPDLVSGLLSIA